MSLEKEYRSLFRKFLESSGKTEKLYAFRLKKLQSRMLSCGYDASSWILIEQEERLNNKKEHASEAYL